MRFEAVENKFRDQAKMMEQVNASAREAVAAANASAKAAVEAAMSASQKAIDKADASTDKKFESVNEFRAALSDAGRLTMPRSECEQMFKTLTEKIADVTARQQARDDRGEGQGQIWAIVIAAVGVMSSIIAIFIALSNAASKVAG